MKLLNFQQLAAQPEGVICSPWEPAYCEFLYKKGKTIHDAEGTPVDFFVTSLVPSCWQDFDIIPPIIDESGSRWRVIEPGQLFAVFEEKDLAALRRIVAAAVPAATD